MIHMKKLRGPAWLAAAAAVAGLAGCGKTVVLNPAGDIAAQQGDLVVTAMISAGAEVIADGNIHVYAPLRGRALAGASGDKEARIFTTSMEAELVSVAGIYRTFEAGVPDELTRQPTTISLRDDGGELRLDVAALALR